MLLAILATPFVDTVTQPDQVPLVQYLLYNVLVAATNCSWTCIKSDVELNLINFNSILQDLPETAKFVKLDAPPSVLLFHIPSV